MSFSSYSDSSLSPPPDDLPQENTTTIGGTRSRPKVQTQLNLAATRSSTAGNKRPRDEDIFAAAVAASKTATSQAPKKQKQMKFSSVLEDELMSEDEDEELDEEGDEEGDFITPDAAVKPEPSPPPEPSLIIKFTKPPRKRLVLEPRTPSNVPEVSVIVMFRAKFADAYDGVPDLGPQDIEEGIVSPKLTPEVDAFLCRTLSLVLNRKKNIELGHYTRAIEEALSANGALYWGPNRHNGPFVSHKSFTKLDWEGRLEFLIALVHWALTSSDIVRKILAQGYSAGRLEDDRNCPLAVSALGMDGERRRYYLIEGLNDTRFRLFRETNPRKRLVNWTPIASTPEELSEFARKLADEDTSRNAKSLVQKLNKEVPRLEAGDVKRKRLLYRVQRKQVNDEIAALAAEVDGGIYHGRTRGKRVNYNASDEEFDGDSRRSTRRNSPGTDSSVVYTTASGRASRRPAAVAFESGIDPDMLDSNEIFDDSPRELRKAAQKPLSMGYASEDLEEEDEDEEYSDDRHESEPDEEFDDVRERSSRNSLPVVLKYRQAAAVVQ